MAAACAAMAAALPSGTQQVGVRPEHWLACAPHEGLALTVQATEYLGAQRLVQGSLADQTRFEWLVSGEQALAVGDVRHVRAPATHLHAFDDQGRRIEGAQP